MQSYFLFYCFVLEVTTFSTFSTCSCHHQVHRVGAVMYVGVNIHTNVSDGRHFREQRFTDFSLSLLSWSLTTHQWSPAWWCWWWFLLSCSVGWGLALLHWADRCRLWGWRKWERSWRLVQMQIHQEVNPQPLLLPRGERKKQAKKDFLSAVEKQCPFCFTYNNSNN